MLLKNLIASPEIHTFVLIIRLRSQLKKNKRNDKRFNNRSYSLFF